ncbi:MAG: flavin reductase family protein [bacterium]
MDLTEEEMEKVSMDANAKKTALRMIPYGLYVLASRSNDGQIATATINWVTQASFEPPLVAIGVKRDSAAHAFIQESGSFALNVLGKGQQDLAFAFFKSPEAEGDTVGGQKFSTAVTGSPVFENAAAYLDCRMTEMAQGGDHSIFLGEVVDAEVRRQIEARADDETLLLRDLGEKTFYGG